MDSVFIKVPVSERLPAIEKYYHTNQGTVYFDTDKQKFKVPFNPLYVFTYWLEECTLPTEEDITKSSFENTSSLREACDYRQGCDFILNHIKKGGK